MKTPGARKKVCFYCVATHLGGAERSLLELLAGLKDEASGWEPWVLLPKEDGPLLPRLKELGVRTTILPMPSSFLELSRSTPFASLQRALRSFPGMSAYLFRLNRLMAREKPDLIHTTGVKCHYLSTLTRSLNRIPVLWHIRDIFPRGPVRTSLKTLARATGVTVVFNSHATARAWSRKVNSTQVVYNGLNPDQYRPNPRRDFHDRFRIPPGTPVVGILGVIATWKGQREFIRMAAELVGRGSNAHFVIIGAEIYDTGSDRGITTELKADAAHLGVESQVHFAGFSEDPVAALSSLDILVHASIRPEPFGRVVIEGMACGIPVVASSAGGIEEIIRSGDTGLLFPPGNIQLMADSVERLLKDAALRARLADQGRSEFLKRFTSRQHVENMIALFEQARP